MANSHPDRTISTLYNNKMIENKKRIPRYERISNPPIIRLTSRDQQILEAIHAFDGMLSFRQICRMHFTGKSQAEHRMKLLYQNGYVNRPSQDQRRRLPEMIYWLDREGANLIARLNGLGISEIGWRKEPRWYQVDHDIAVNDFRLDLHEACMNNSDISLESWIPESEFWAYPDMVTYKYNNRDIRRKVRPDGFFMLTFGDIRIRYLLEIDRSTEDNPRFMREKVLPGLAYLNSDVYENRFGHRSGRWLVVTTGQRRMDNMLRQARKAKTKGLFYFTTYEHLRPATILTEPIWKRADREDTVPLIFLD